MKLQYHTDLVYWSQFFFNCLETNPVYSFIRKSFSAVQIFPQYWANIAKYYTYIVQILSKYSRKQWLYIAKIFYNQFPNIVYISTKYCPNFIQMLSKYYSDIVHIATLGLYLGFSAKLRILQVSSCKMHPQSGIIF